MKIGVLGLQGDVREHVSALNKCGADTSIVKRVNDLEGISGLVIPGGESTTVCLLMNKFGFIDSIKDRVAEGMGVFGTCTGLILLASEIEGSNQYRLNLMNMVVRRNAFGRQVDSGEADIDIPVLGAKPFHTVFIRAPIFS
jgi:5'-phosphate synthase pdxT subunit